MASYIKDYQIQGPKGFTNAQVTAGGITYRRF